MSKLNIREDFETMLDKLTALYFKIEDQSKNYLERELYELQRDDTTLEDFYAFRAMLIFARDLGLIKEYLFDTMKERVDEIWDAYQEAGAPPTAAGATPTDHEQLTLFT